MGRGSAFHILAPRAGLPASGEMAVGDISNDGLGHGGLNVCRLADARILVIEDHAAVREAMAQLLAGWRAVAAPDEAATPGNEPAPAVLFCDYRLREGVTGAEATAMLRLYRRRVVPTLIITGDTVQVRRREAMESGVPVIHKPMPHDRLYSELLRLVGNRGHRHRLT